MLLTKSEESIPRLVKYISLKITACKDDVGHYNNIICSSSVAFSLSLCWPWTWSVSFSARQYRVRSIVFYGLHWSVQCRVPSMSQLRNEHCMLVSSRIIALIVVLQPFRWCALFGTKSCAWNEWSYFILIGTFLAYIVRIILSAVITDVIFYTKKIFATSIIGSLCSYSNRRIGLNH